MVGVEKLRWSDGVSYGRRCFYRLGAGWWVYKTEMVLMCVARLTASREATLGRRVSECVVAFTVWGLGGGC